MQNARERLQLLEEKASRDNERLANSGEADALASAGSDASDVTDYDDLHPSGIDGAKSAQQEMQLSFFDAVPSPVLQRLRSLDLMDTTPSQALKILEELQELLK